MELIAIIAVVLINLMLMMLLSRIKHYILLMLLEVFLTHNLVTWSLRWIRL